MLDKIIGAVLGYALCKVIGIFQSGGSLASLLPSNYVVHASSTPHPATGQPVMTPAAPEGGLQVTSTAVSFPTATPNGLPPFPSGWKPAKTTPDIVQRAQVLLKTLPLNQSKLEKASDGRWIRYLKNKQGTKTMVTAWEPKVALASTTQPIMSGRHRRAS